jgi:hypothetical protein
MKKLFGMLFAVLLVFCIAGSAGATPFKHGDGKKWKIQKIKPIKIHEVNKNISDTSFNLKPLKKKKLKKNKSNGLESNDFKSIFKEDCGKVELRVCQTDPPSNHAPEPATMLLFGVGLAGFGIFMKKFKKA